MQVGDIYFMNRGFLPSMKNPKNRHYEILAISLTHVYIRNLRLGTRYNVSINSFNENYEPNLMLRRK